MIPTTPPALLIDNQPRSREQELPTEPEACSGVLPVERTGQRGPSGVPLSVAAMRLSNVLDLPLECRADSIGQ